MKNETTKIENLSAIARELNVDRRTVGKYLDGFQKKEILDQVDLGKGKTQGYAFIEKTQKIALKLYNDKYRD